MIPSNAKRVPLRPLALGEKTGHHHSLVAEPGVILEASAEIYEVETEDGAKTTFLRITEEGVSFQHQEHKTHLLPLIDYRVRIQQEVTDWGDRSVLD